MSTKAPRLNDALADLRERIVANRLDVAPDVGQPVQLGSIVDAIEARCEDTRSRGNEPHHLDPTISSDAREQFYAMAAWALSAAMHLDRLAVGKRSTTR